jgi:hypothetical protein
MTQGLKRVSRSTTGETNKPAAANAAELLDHLRHHGFRLQKRQPAHVQAALQAVAEKIPPHDLGVMLVGLGCGVGGHRGSRPSWRGPPQRKANHPSAVPWPSSLAKKTSTSPYTKFLYLIQSVFSIPRSMTLDSKLTKLLNE